MPCRAIAKEAPMSIQKILLVDDSKTELHHLSDVLGKRGYQVRTAENRIVQAEKMASMQKIDLGMVYPAAAINDAWRSLMLAQHHD